MGLQLAPAREGEPTIADLVRIEGTVAAPWAMALAGSRDHRDVTDAMHALCVLYGAHPNPIDSAIDRGDDAALHAWLVEASDAFTNERRYLTAVVSAAGPLPSTPGQAQSAAAIAQQRHALDMLAKSDRAGCAIGAGVALVLDWHAVRPIVDRVAMRVGVAPVPLDLPVEGPVASADAGVARARLFGARQLLTQQRGLWSLLEARAAARGH